MCCVLCAVLYLVLLCGFFSFHAQMYWDACIRSPYTCFVMSSFKGLLSHSVRAFLSNSTDTEKATAWSHSTKSQQQHCKYIEEFSECISRVTSRRAAWTHMHDIPIYEEENIFCAKNCNKRKTCKITRKRNEESRERTNKRRQLLCIMCKARKTISNLKLQAYEKAT